MVDTYEEVGEQIMLDDLANAEDNTLIEDGKKVENLIAEFPFRFERAWRLHETGGRSAHNRVIGASDDGKHKGTPVHYCACPCPVYDHVTNTTKRCGYVVKVEGRGAQRIDAIRHAKKANHYKWWSENVMAKQEKGDPALKGIPPLTTVVELPTWVDPGLKEGGFVKGMSDDEYAVMVADRDEALADYKRNNEIRETYEKKDKKGKKKEEDF